MAERQFNYTVCGAWPFPVDMLRHDGSKAATSADQEIIDRLSGEHASDREDFRSVEINLTGPYKPNTARWESFGWSVPSDEEYAWLKAAAARDRAERRIVQTALEKLSDMEQRVLARHFAARGQS